MDNSQVIEQTLQNFEFANEAMLDLWDHFDLETLDKVLEKQQHRLEQIAERIYHEEIKDDFDDQEEILTNTLARYEWANQYLYEHWDTLPNEERLSIIQKQWNRLQDMRNRSFH